MLLPLLAMGSPGLRGLAWALRAGSRSSIRRSSDWRPEHGALVCPPGGCGPRPSRSQGSGLEEMALKRVSQVFPARGATWHRWTAQVWCHKDPASGQMLPGQAVRPQGSGFSEQRLAPGRGEHLGPGSSHCHQSKDCILGAGVRCEGCRGPACPVLRWHLRSRGSLWEGVLCTPPPW